MMILSASSTVVEWMMIDSDVEWRHCFRDGDMWRNECSGEEGWMGARECSQLFVQPPIQMLNVEKFSVGQHTLLTRTLALFSIA